MSRRRAAAAPAKGVPWKPPTSWLVSRAVIETVDGEVLDKPSVDILAHSVRCQVEKRYPRGARVRITLEALDG